MVGRVISGEVTCEWLSRKEGTNSCLIKALAEQAPGTIVDRSSHSHSLQSYHLAVTAAAAAAVSAEPAVVESPDTFDSGHTLLLLLLQD
jgi:hypothetical protein